MRVRAPLLALGFLLLAAYLVAVNPFKALVEVEHFDGALFALAVAVNYVGLVFLALSWHILLRALGVEVGLRESVEATFAALFLVWLFPVPSGFELVRAHLAQRAKGGTLGKAVSSVIISKVYYFLGFGALISLAFAKVSWFQRQQIPVDPRYIWFTVLYALANTALFAVILKPQTFLGLHQRSPTWLRDQLEKRVYNKRYGLGGVQAFAAELDSSLRTLKSRPLVNLASLLLVSFHWATGAVTANLVSRALGQALNLWHLVLVYAVVEFIQQLNILVPSGLGVVDATLTGALVMLGLPLGLAASISLLTRLATYWFELVLCGLVTLGLGYRELSGEVFS